MGQLVFVICISVRSRVFANELHAVFHRYVVCAVKTYVAIGFKTSIEAYYVEKNSAS